MKVLVINCGSSSLKYQLIDMAKKDLMAKGLVERIGLEGAVLTHEIPGKDKVEIVEPMKDHKKALELVLNAVADEKIGAIADMKEIGAVGHRVVHGGEKFASSVVIDDEVLNTIRECSDLAPLHNPPNIMGIEACKAILPDTPMVGVFDTAFHQTIPAENYIYALPYELYETNQIRRYGFHGTSHQYVTQRAADMLGVEVSAVNLITCHLGNGASITAVRGGKSFDTSMGFTPLEGLAMGTRTGDMDPAIVTYLLKKGMSVDEVDNLMNKKSGVLGISGVSSDFRDLESAAGEGNERARLALDVFRNRVVKYIGGYYAMLGDVDGIVFTAGLGENGATARKEICAKLASLGVEIDDDLNAQRGKEMLISTESSSVNVMVIPTNEELMIAEETLALVKYVM